MVETWLCQVTMCSREICSSICSLWMGSFAWLAWLPLRSMVRRMLKPLKARNWHYILHVRIHYSGLTSSVRLQNLSTQEVISQYQKKRAAMCCLFPLLTSFHVAFWSAPSMQSTRLLDGTRQGVVVLSNKLDRSWCWHLLSLHRTCRFQNEYSKMKQVITESNRIWLHFLNNSIEAYLQIQLCIY
jgi:hypothetical protein